jgi:hypothetical protein
VAYTYRVSVELGGTVTEGGTVGILTRTNHAPLAAQDIVFYSGQVRFNPLENDSDEDVPAELDPNLAIGTPLVQPPADSGSSAQVSDDGKAITYTPGNDSAGRDSLVYEAVDPYGLSSTAEVRLIDFFQLSGFYSGIVTESGTESPGTAIALQLGATGAISTSFMGFDGERYPIKGTFGANGRLAATFAKTNAPGTTFTLTFQLLPDPIVINNRSVRAINATFQETANGVPSALVEFTLTEGAIGGVASSGTLTALITGRSLRTVSDVQPGEASDTVLVEGDGYVIMTIGKTRNRRARVAGRLPDGEPFTSSAMAPFGKTYQLAAANLYRRASGGSVAGRINVLEMPAETGPGLIQVGMLSDLSWRRRSSPRSAAYPQGIAGKINMEGLAYPVSGNGGMLGVLGLPGPTASAKLTLSGSDLPPPSPDNNALSVVLLIQSNSVQVSEPNPLKLKLKVNPATARFTGSFIHPVSRLLTNFDGALQGAYGSSLGKGQGCILTKRFSGAVRIEPMP